ncbi:hypothetical protein M8J75_012055 [Diaphorina citri]|nr:hypothetical protein M8J75_012055 [Diaphorina citri]
MQPFDVAFFKPLGMYFTNAQEKWLRSNSGLQITQYHMTGLLNEAYGRAATVRTAENAFRATGIWPTDQLVFKENLFSAANALDNSMPTEIREDTASNINSENQPISKRLSNGQLFPVPTSVQPGQQPSLNQQGQYHGLDRMINITPPQLGIPPLSIQTQGKHHQQQQGQLQVAGYFWFIMDSYPSYSFTWPEEYPEGRSRSHTQ